MIRAGSMKSVHPIGHFEKRRVIPHAMMPTITHSRELVSTSKPLNIHRVQKDGAIPPLCTHHFAKKKPG
jgi:hypothetical protein